MAHTRQPNRPPTREPHHTVSPAPHRGSCEETHGLCATVTSRDEDSRSRQHRLRVCSCRHYNTGGSALGTPVGPCTALLRVPVPKGTTYLPGRDPAGATPTEYKLPRTGQGVRYSWHCTAGNELLPEQDDCPRRTRRAGHPLHRRPETQLISTRIRRSHDSRVVGHTRYLVVRDGHHRFLQSTNRIFRSFRVT